MKRILAVALLSAVLPYTPWSHGQTPSVGASQGAATGVITGRVFNPNTGEYLRNAQVRIEETGQTAISESGGEFRLAPVPAGKATLVVTYTGYRSVTAAVNVAPGAAVAQDVFRHMGVAQSKPL